MTAPHQLSLEALEFLTERHHATLTTLRADGSPHVVAVGFTFDPAASLARVITFAGSVKARNVSHGTHGSSGCRAALGQVDGGRWITLEGVARVSSDPARVAAAVAAYAARYRQPAERLDRVVIEISVDRVLGSSRMKTI